MNLTLYVCSLILDIFPVPFILLFALGDFLNIIPALSLNILVWKLDFNFLRMLLVSESSNFPGAYSYFMKAISPKPFLQIVFGIFSVVIALSCTSLLRLPQQNTTD